MQQTHEAPLSNTCVTHAVDHPHVSRHLVRPQRPSSNSSGHEIAANTTSHSLEGTCSGTKPDCIPRPVPRGHSIKSTHSAVQELPLLLALENLTRLCRCPSAHGPGLNRTCRVWVGRDGAPELHWFKALQPAQRWMGHHWVAEEGVMMVKPPHEGC
jgi:hypothetical protein